MAKSENKNWIFWIVLLVIFASLVYILRSVLLPFVVGIIIGYLLDPLATRLEKLKINRTLATCLVLLLVAVILIPALVALVHMIDEQLALFISAVPKYMESLSQKMEPVINNLQDRFPNLNREKFREYLRGNMSNTLKVIGSLLRRVISGSYALFSILSLVLITPIVTFYMLRDWNAFTKKVDSLLPKAYKKEIRKRNKISCLNMQIRHRIHIHQFSFIPDGQQTHPFGMFLDYRAAARALGQGKQLRKGPARKQHRCAGAFSRGNAPDAFRLLPGA